MKVNIKDNNTSTEIKYPCLMIHKRNGGVVLFTAYCEGTVLKAAQSHVGLHSKLFCIHDFKPFTGTIELSND